MRLSERPSIIGNLEISEAEALVASVLPDKTYTYVGCRYVADDYRRQYVEEHGEIPVGLYASIGHGVWESEGGAVMVQKWEDYGRGQSSSVYFEAVE